VDTQATAFKFAPDHSIELLKYSQEDLLRDVFRCRQVAGIPIDIIIKKAVLVAINEFSERGKTAFATSDRIFHSDSSIQWILLHIFLYL
jgi:hypothetical protein